MRSSGPPNCPPLLAPRRRTSRWVVPLCGLLLACGAESEGSDPVPPPPPPPAMMMMPDPPMEMELPPIPSKEYSTAHPLGYYPLDQIPDGVAYVTIDDGPSEYTMAFLDILKDKGVKATFFLNAYGLKGSLGLEASYTDPKTMLQVAYRDVVKRQVTEGHVLGNHTLHHPDLAKSTAAEMITELDHNQALINQTLAKTGTKLQSLSLIRPPYGSPFISRLHDDKLTDADRVLLRSVGAALMERGLNILWNLDSSDSADWAKDEWYTNSMPQPPGKASSFTFTEKIERIKQTVLQDPLVLKKKGVVILFHDTHPCTRDALAAVIDGLRAAGYRFGTVEELAQSRWQRPSADLTPGPSLWNDRVAVRDWGCLDFSKALGAPVRTRANELCGRSWRFFDQNGGIAALGRPLSEPQEDPATGLRQQWLERSRLVIHPDVELPHDVGPANLGIERLTQLGINWRTTTQAEFQEEATAQPGCQLLTRAATDGGRGVRHNLCETAVTPGSGAVVTTGFLSFWKALPDPLTVMGYPLSAAYRDPTSGHFIQWFERARLEWSAAQPHAQLATLGIEGRM